MTEKIHLGWSDISSRCAEVANRLRHSDSWPRAIYGVPRGGCVPAAMLADSLDALLVDDPTDADLIVDDLIDSGATRDRFDGKRFVALYAKPWSPDGLLVDPEIRDGWIVFPWEGDESSPTDAVVRLLSFIGEDPNRPGLQDTPERVVRAMAEMTAGYNDDPAKILSRTFPDRCDEMVVVRGVEFTSLCEHHLLPFVGEVDLAYVPDQCVVGLSKLARLVDCFARRLQVQERMTVQIAEAIQTHLEPKGVGVVVRARHSCMGCRGVRKPSAEMVTSALHGALRDKPEARAEFLSLSR